MKYPKLQYFLRVFAILVILGVGMQQKVTAQPLRDDPITEIIILGELGHESSRATQTLPEIEHQAAISGTNMNLESPPFMTAAESILAEEIALPAVQSPTAILANSPSPANNFVALQDNISSIPPDTHGAAGPNHLMTTLNSQVRIQTRTGTNLSTVTLNSFWSSVNGGSGTFDPKVLYDPYNNRWIAVACDDSRSATSAFSMAVSANSDPTGTWHFFRIQLNDGTNWIDYPSLGFNKDWIVVNVNIFTTAGLFVRTEVYAFDKATTYGGASAPYTRFTTVSAFTLVPAITYDNSLNTEYLVMTYNSTSGIIRMARITGPVGAESLTLDNTNIISSLGGWSSAPAGRADFAPQLGSIQKIQNNDHRMQNLVYRNGYLWTTHTIFLPSGGSPTRSAVQWWQINPSGYSIVQNGRIDDNTGTNFYAFPSIAVNQNDDVLIGFSRFSASQYASGNYAFRNSDDPINTMRSDVVLKAGEAPYYKIYTGTQNRWGDYSNTVVDPVNDTDFWTIQEYAWTNNGTYDRWGTWWGQVVPPPAAFSKSSPSNGATDQAINPTLLWGSSSGVTSYDYCYDTTNNNTCDTAWTSAGNSTSAALSGLSAGSTYYWQVRANNTYGTTYANADTWWSFTTQSNPPGAFNKLNPPSASINQSITPTFSWESSTNAAGYEYCYDTTDDNTCDGTWTSAGSNTSATISGLNYSTTYYWQVRASNTAGYTYANSGTWWAFSTQIAPPADFNKIDPNDGAADQPTDPTLSWENSTGAASYEYCYDTSNNNTCDAAWVSVGVDISVALSNLDSGTTYFWQVRASNATGFTYANSGTWWSFTTLVAPPAAFNKLSPNDGAADQPINPTLSWESSAGAASYEYCYDTTDNNTCDGTWISTGSSTSVALSLSAATIYYWQVRAHNTRGDTYADIDAWWSFTTQSHYFLYLPVILNP